MLCLAIPVVGRAQHEAPTSAQDIKPLLIGASIPDVVLQTPDGKAFDLKAAAARKPTVLIFYRGGWCPYCNLHLGQLQTVESDLLTLGFQILALSPDQPTKLAGRAEKDKSTNTLLSDSSMAAAKAFGIAFRVDAATLDQYKGYGIDLEVASGQAHHLLPVPAVFVLDTDGKVKSAHANPDYKTRLAPDDFLEIVQTAKAGDTNRLETIVTRIREHDFHPIRDGFTYDRNLNTHGIADLGNDDWRLRLLVARDLVRLGTDAPEQVIPALHDANVHVRQVAAMALGIVRATNAVFALERALRDDSDDIVRSQAAVALGQIGARNALDELRRAHAEDASRDVRHQAELAAYAVEQGLGATPELAAAYRGLDEENFERIGVGEPAIDFVLPDTEGRAWRLSDHRGKRPVALLWVFADWCPVCHGEFRELIELRREFEAAGVEVVTLECHDVFPARVMVGQEIEPEYWFSKTSFQEIYTKNIWWPHLVDRAGAVGATYGVQPLAYAVHAEYINRPAVVIVDKEGIVRLAYYGTFWGDRPSIHQVLEMIRSNRYHFESERRLKAK